jgi:hypothetical protein
MNPDIIGIENFIKTPQILFNVALNAISFLRFKAFERTDICCVQKEIASLNEHQKKRSTV